MVVIANICSFVGIMMLAYSTFQKDKKKMLYIQVGDCLFHSIANTLLGNYAAASTNIICASRNILNAKEKNNKWINVILMLLIAIIGLAVNKNGFIGLLPVIASIEYSMCCFLFKNTQVLRVSLMINMLMYAIHNILCALYVGAAGECTLIIITFYSIIKHRKNKNIK